MLEVFANMPKRETSDAGVKKDGKLFFKVDMLGRPIPRQLQLIYEGMKHMFVDP
jgi:hypothetical protein